MGAGEQGQVSWNHDERGVARRIETRGDLVQWLGELLPDPFSYTASTGASYGDSIRRLEFASRPLWAVFSLIAGGDCDNPLIAPWIERLRAGLGDGSLAFPYPTTKTRQIAVEMGVYGFGLISCRDRLLDLLSPREVQVLVAWLNSINEIELPWGNWFLFRVIVNYGLRANGLPYDADRLQADVRAIESMYSGNGWYEDGRPFQRDSYVATVFHLYSLLIEAYVPGHELVDPCGRSKAFEDDFLYWSDAQGRSLPFGRSLSYRFAQVGYWAATVLSGANSHSLAEVKQLALSQLTWWRNQLAGARGLEIGFAYPNLLVSEDYTGPGAPYWACKAFLLLALPKEHPFWSVAPQAPVRERLRVEREPGMLFRSGGRHTYALAAMQYSGASVLQRMSKYGKFCYSTAFGWNMSRDVEGISTFAIDSALALSVVHTGQYLSRSRIDAHRVTEAYAYSMWGYRGLVHVETWLIPIDEFWHARVHRITAAYPLETYEGAFPVFRWNAKFDEAVGDDRSIVLYRASCADGGGAREGVSSASDGAQADAVAISAADASRAAGASCTENATIGRDNTSNVLMIPRVGAIEPVPLPFKGRCGQQASAIVDAAQDLERLRALLLQAGLFEELGNESFATRSPEVVSQNPNTNLMDCESNAVPTLKGAVEGGYACYACFVYGDPGCD